MQLLYNHNSLLERFWQFLFWMMKMLKNRIFYSCFKIVKLQLRMHSATFAIVTCSSGEIKDISFWQFIFINNEKFVVTFEQTLSITRFIISHFLLMLPPNSSFLWFETPERKVPSWICRIYESVNNSVDIRRWHGVWTFWFLIID